MELTKFSPAWTSALILPENYRTTERMEPRSTSFRQNMMLPRKMRRAPPAPLMACTFCAPLLSLFSVSVSSLQSTSGATLQQVLCCTALARCKHINRIADGTAVVSSLLDNMLYNNWMTYARWTSSQCKRHDNTDQTTSQCECHACDVPNSARGWRTC
jgi:hypothetical protein